MKIHNRVAALALLCLLPLAWVQAQTLTFTAETVTGAGSVVPKLTWATTPAATGCTASGDTAWTGAKAASGTATLAAITASKTYNLTCTWPAGNTATLKWVPPTLNTDGTPYTDPKGFSVHWGTAAASLTQTKAVNTPAATTDTITGLAAGTWFFCVKAINAADVASACSNTASKALVAGTANRTVGIVVNPLPNAPTGLTVE